MLKHELGDKETIISDLRNKHELYTKEIREKFRSKLEEQNGFIDNLKAELESSMKRNQDY